MIIRTINIIRTEDGTKMLHALEQSERPAFDRLAPYGLQVFAARCIEVDGKLYPLADGCPADGLTAWTAAGEEEAQEALDAAVASLPRSIAERSFPGFQPWSVRKAQRALDDAEADVRALEARGAKGAELAQAKADAESKRAALDEAKAGRGKP